jgi:hypothetical protein
MRWAAKKTETPLISVTRLTRDASAPYAGTNASSMSAWPAAA